MQSIGEPRDLQFPQYMLAVNKGGWVEGQGYPILGAL